MNLLDEIPYEFLREITDEYYALTGIDIQNKCDLHHAALSYAYNFELDNVKLQYCQTICSDNENSTYRFAKDIESCDILLAKDTLKNNPVLLEKLNKIIVERCLE